MIVTGGTQIHQKSEIPNQIQKQHLLTLKELRLTVGGYTQTHTHNQSQPNKPIGKSSSQQQRNCTEISMIRLRIAVNNCVTSENGRKNWEQQWQEIVVNVEEFQI
jgi:hypothetical protein